jgi:hypothetical protein
MVAATLVVCVEEESEHAARMISNAQGRRRSRRTCMSGITMNCSGMGLEF